MTLPTGQISMSQVNVELSQSSTAQISLNDANVRALAGVLSGQISMSDLWGKSANTGFVFSNNQSTSAPIRAFPISASGFTGTSSAPGTYDSSTGLDIAIHPSANALVVGISGSPYVNAFVWSSSTGFGTKFTNPGTAPASGANGVTFSPNGAYVACAVGSAPYQSVYTWSGSGFGTRFSNPGVSVGNASSVVEFSPLNNYIAFGKNASPYIMVYNWSASGFGSKISNPSTAVPNTVFGISFSPSQNAIALGSASSPYVIVYPWSTGFGTKYADPATLPGGNTRGVLFSPSGNVLFSVNINSSPYVNAWAWSVAGFGTKYSSPAVSDQSASVSINGAENTLAVGTTSSPHATMYEWSNSTGFGTRYVAPSILSIPTGSANLVINP